MAVKVVKTLVLSGGFSLKVLKGNPGPGLVSKDIDTTDLSSTNRRTFSPEAQLEEAEISLECDYNDGKLAPVGASVSLTITVTKGDGTTIANAIAGYVKSAEPAEVDVGGERRLIQKVVFRPDGTNTAISTTTG